MKKHPRALEGKFAHITPNGKIRLSQEKITVSIYDRAKIKTRGDLYLELSPSLDFVIKTKLSGKAIKALPFPLDQVDLQIDRSPKSSWFITDIHSKHINNKHSVNLAGTTSRANIEFHPVENLSYSNFHLVNFPQFLGLVIEYPNGEVTRGRLELKADDWKIKIDSTPYTDKNLKLLNRLSGYAITHVGRLEKVNRRRFSSHEATELANQIMYFLSFAIGMWVNPILFNGFDSKNQEVWQGWFIHHSRPWKKPSFSWYDTLHATEILPATFAGYIHTITNPIWSEVIRYAIYWYIQTNISNVDSGLILGQAALELLTWNYLTIDKKVLSRNKFKKNSAADNLRVFLTNCSIPTEIPPTSKELVAYAKPKEDGPALITRVRNNLVHPEKSHRSKKIPFFHILNLQQWYIELILLKLFNYNGNYFNRLGQNLWKGNVEPVPWT